MKEMLRSPIARFVVGFLAAIFFFVPVMWVLHVPLTPALFLLPVTAVGIVGGVMCARTPPRMHAQPLDPAMVFAPELFKQPSARFLAGFLSSSLLFIPVMLLIGGPPDLSILPSMLGVGLLGGLLWVRNPPRFLTKRRGTSSG